MAIGRRLSPELTPIILTLSKAVTPVREQGFYAEYFPSPHATDLSGSAWNTRFTARMASILAEYEPAVVLFDGTYPYRGLRDTIETHRQRAWVWIRRPMWLPDVNPRGLQSSGLFDLVIEPGEFAAEADIGPTVALREQAATVPPILFSDESEILSREEAETDLGLKAGQTHALIQLGEVRREQRDFMMQACASHILQYPGTEVAVLQSAISKNLVLPSAVHKLSATYPIARFYRAFDFVISAAGYNSFHELINFQIPAAFFPVRKPTDNQAARARYAEDSGVAVEVGLDTSRAVEVLISSKEREKMRRKAGERRFDNGAGEAAEMIAQLAAAPEAAPAARPHRGRGKPQPVSGRGDASPARPLSLKAVTAKQLSGIPGIGPATAEKIIEMRDRHGGLASLRELEQLSGIGPATMETLRAQLRP